MVLSLLASTGDKSIHIPLELFIALLMFTLMGILGFFTWLTKQVIKLSQILGKMQTEQINMRADIDQLMRHR